MKGDPRASFPVRDIYVDTGQMHGGHGVTRLLSLIHHHDQGHDQLKFCLITGHYQEAAPGHDKINYTWCSGIPRPIRGFTLQYIGVYACKFKGQTMALVLYVENVFTPRIASSLYMGVKSSILRVISL